MLMFNNNLTDEAKEKNYFLFKKKLEQLNIDTSIFDEKIKEKLVNATFSIGNDKAAFDGSLLEIVLRVLTPTAIKINEIFPEEMRANQQSLIKVALLMHIAKCQMFIKNDNEWEKEKLNKKYKYADSDVALKLGMKSLILAQELGIKFTPLEIEAITSIDREANDEQFKYFASPLSAVIKEANNIINVIIRNLI